MMCRPEAGAKCPRLHPLFWREEMTGLRNRRGRIIAQLPLSMRNRLREAWRLMRAGVSRKELSPEYIEALRFYYRMRAKDAAERQFDVAHNQEYHEWLRRNNLPTRPFNQKFYNKWKRQRKKMESR